MSAPETGPIEAAYKPGFSGAQVAGIVLVTVLLTAALGWWLVTRYVFPEQLQAVELSETEESELARKLAVLGVRLPVRQGDAAPPVEATPEPYSEAGASRVVELTERELNGLIARDPEWGSRVAIDLATDLASLTALVPVPPDFPVMPGKTLRVTAGAELAFRADRPVVMLKGVSVMGVPVPNAWLGNLKNVDLVSEFGDQSGFWQGFADGVEEIQISEGKLLLHLRE